MTNQPSSPVAMPWIATQGWQPPQTLAESEANIDWGKVQDLVPAVIQHFRTHQVLMLGYMNKEALQKTAATGNITFFSRTKNRLWTKGETSGNTLSLVGWQIDCDQDTLLLYAEPKGPTCHLGTTTCFEPGVEPEDVGAADHTLPSGVGFLPYLQSHLEVRAKQPADESYTARLMQKGVAKIAQKVGEEGLETALAAVDPNQSSSDLLGEASDLLYHLLVLLNSQEIAFEEVIARLQDRHR